MDIAIVTGASSALGLAISRRLIDMGFRVYGLGGDYQNCPLTNINFRPLACDLADPEAVRSACGTILEREGGVCVVVNNAKFMGKVPFREMGVAEMERILRVNLLTPLVLVRYLEESLRKLQGYVIQIGAASTASAPAGAAGAAAAGGLKWMGEALFNDLRDAGVRVCHLSPEPNRARSHAAALPGARAETVIDPEAVAQAIEQLLSSPYGNTVTEMVLRPLRVEECPLPRVVKVPSPEPQPIPYTVPREVIEAEDLLEEEEFAEKSRQKSKRRKERSAAASPAVGEPDTTAADESPAAKPAAKQPAKPAAKPSAKPAAKPHPEPAPEPAGQVAEPAQTAADPQETSLRRRKLRRKPKPPLAPIGFLDRVKPPEAETESKPVVRKTAVKTAKKAAVKMAKKAARKVSRKKAVD